MKLREIALLTLANIVGFFALKSYNDLRQVRLVSALLPSVVELGAVGPVIEKKPYLTVKDGNLSVGFKIKRLGFEKVFSGSGVFIASSGLIMTCNHLTRHTGLFEVGLEGFEPLKLPLPRYKTTGKMLAYVVGRDEDADIALLRIISPKKAFQPVRLGDRLAKGLPVLTIGFPSIFKKHVTTGVVSSFRDGVTFSDVVIEHGSSGGGVFDMDGRLIGLASFMWTPEETPITGFTGITSLYAMRRLLKKYEGF